MKAGASRLIRTIDINHAIRTRACQAGGRGRSVSISAETLARIGFIEITPGYPLPRITELFVRFVLDPASVLKEAPDLPHGLREMSPDEQAFFCIAQREIFERLQLVVGNELKSGESFTTEQRIRAILLDLAVKPWQKDPRHDLAQISYSTFTLAGNFEARITIKNLIGMGFIDKITRRERRKSILHMVTPHFICFVVDPAHVLKENPDLNPFRTSINSGERLLYDRIREAILRALGEQIAEAEKGHGQPLLTEERVAIIYGAFQGNSK
jgi:hypothetical protein